MAANPRILWDDLLIIGKEFSGFDRTNERLELLAVDSAGRLVVIELKRDDSGTDVLTYPETVKLAKWCLVATPTLALARQAFPSLRFRKDETVLAVLDFLRTEPAVRNGLAL